MAPGAPASTQDAVPMLPGISTGCPMRAVRGGELAMAGRKGARGALAVHQHVALAPFVSVFLAFGDVVADVVDQI